MKRSEANRRLLDRWRESGLSLLAFGRQEGVPYSRLLYWKKKLAGEASNQLDGALVPIEVAAASSTTASATVAKIEVWLPNGIGLEVGAEFDEEELRRLIGVLQSC